MKFKNISSLGELRIPAIRQVVKGGEVFDVAADLAELFALQPSNYEPADKAATALVKSLADRAAADLAAQEAADAAAEEAAAAERARIDALIAQSQAEEAAREERIARLLAEDDARIADTNKGN